MIRFRKTATKILFAEDWISRPFPLCLQYRYGAELSLYKYIDRKQDVKEQFRGAGETVRVESFEPTAMVRFTPLPSVQVL
jgi:hypothetical protein